MGEPRDPLFNVVECSPPKEAADFKKREIQKGQLLLQGSNRRQGGMLFHAPPPLPPSQSSRGKMERKRKKRQRERHGKHIQRTISEVGCKRYARLFQQSFRARLIVVMILTQIPLRKPCYDFYFL
jgi:hypothetical protein